MLTRLTATTAVALLLAGCMNENRATVASPTNNAVPSAAPGAGAVSTAAGPNEPISGDPTGAEAGDISMVTVGGAEMRSNRTIVANASEAPNLTTLVAAVQAADLVDTLNGPGPFTVFAPTNDAFAALPAGTVDTLLQPANKADLQGVLTYHVVPGVYDAEAIMAQKGSNLSTSFPTASGGTLSVQAVGDTVYVLDAKGNAARVVQADVYQSNGVVHVIDGVLLP